MYDYDEEKRPEWEVYKDEITKLYIEKEITLIDGDAFEGFTELEAIYYSGTEQEWTELEYTGEKEKEEVFGNVLNYNFAEAEEVPGEETDTEAAETEAADTEATDTEAAEAEETEIVTETEEADANEYRHVHLRHEGGARRQALPLRDQCGRRGTGLEGSEDLP